MRHAVVGIGINVHQESFPGELALIASSLRSETGKSWARQDLLIALLQSLYREAQALSADTTGAALNILSRLDSALTGIRGRHVHVDEGPGYSGITAGLDARGFLQVRERKAFAPCTPGVSEMNDENSMLLTLDVGNTNTVLGLYRLAPDELITHWRVSTLRTQTADEYGVLFLTLFSMRKVEATDVSAIIISSVVPPLESTLRQVCERYFNVKPLFVEPGVKTGMPILIDNPVELGADRMVNGVAAYAKYAVPALSSTSAPPPPST